MVKAVLNPYGWHSIASRKSKGFDFKNCHLKLKKNIFYNKKISFQVEAMEAMEAISSLRGQRILTTTIQMWFLGETALDYCIMLAFMDQVTANYPIVALFAYHCLIVFSFTIVSLMEDGGVDRTVIYCWQHHTLVKSSRIYTWQYTFPILLLNDDNMIGEHKWSKKVIVYGRLF